MSGDTARYVVCYDIPDDRRRTRLAKRLDGYGDRVQDSVFEAVLDRMLFDRLVEDVKGLTEPVEDRVTIYPLCASCAKRSLRLGLASKDVPGEETVFIV